MCARAQLKMKRNGCCLLNAYTQANDDRSRSVCRWRSVGAVEYVWPKTHGKLSTMLMMSHQGIKRSKADEVLFCLFFH